MAKLLDDLGDLWEIVLDLLTFYHECCYNCQPRDDGDFHWLSEEYDIQEVLQELVEGVCTANGVSVPTYLDDDAVAEAIDESPTTCDNCGTEWDSTTPLGGEWLVSRGEDTASARYLLAKTYWPYLTHYTQPTKSLSGVDVLLRIVWDKRIRGSGRMMLDRQEVVAFTECSPLEILALLEAEAAPSPLDFIPLMTDEVLKWKRSRHGIAIRRSALCEAGGVPVIHGDDEIRDCLPKTQRFRYQKFDRKGTFSDWTFEREFRVKGDVSLTAFNPNDVIIIVEDRREMFRVLAQKKVPPFPVMPFDYVFPRENPYPRLTNRQKYVDGYFPEY